MHNDIQSEETKLDGLIEAAQKITHQDAVLRRSLKASLLRGDPAEALEAACSLVGVKPIGSILALIRDKAA
jgi:hypothetical protein